MFDSNCNYPNSQYFVDDIADPTSLDSSICQWSFIEMHQKSRVNKSGQKNMKCSTFHFNSLQSSFRLSNSYFHQQPLGIRTLLSSRSFQKYFLFTVCSLSILTVYILRMNIETCFILYAILVFAVTFATWNMEIYFGYGQVQKIS